MKHMKGILKLTSQVVCDNSSFDIIMYHFLYFTILVDIYFDSAAVILHMF